MKICDILKPEFVLTGLKCDSKENVINKLIDLFKDDKRVENLEDVRSAVIDREKIMSTGVGKGFAIPHAKTNGVNDIIASFAIASEPIDFEALDKKPVKLIFLLVGKENMVAPHIKLLSRISRMMNNEEFRESLLKSENPEEVFNLFKEEEKKYFDLN
jgi:fructose-specific phosphotransferase system IIA component